MRLSPSSLRGQFFVPAALAVLVLAAGGALVAARFSSEHLRSSGWYAARERERWALLGGLELARHAASQGKGLPASPSWSGSVSLNGLEVSVSSSCALVPERVYLSPPGVPLFPGMTASVFWSCGDLEVSGLSPEWSSSPEGVSPDSEGVFFVPAEGEYFLEVRTLSSPEAFYRVGCDPVRVDVLPPDVLSSVLGEGLYLGPSLSRVPAGRPVHLFAVLSDGDSVSQVGFHDASWRLLSGEGDLGPGPAGAVFVPRSPGLAAIEVSAGGHRGLFCFEAVSPKWAVDVSVRAGGASASARIDSGKAVSWSVAR